MRIKSRRIIEASASEQNLAGDHGAHWKDVMIYEINRMSMKAPDYLRVYKTFCAHWKCGCQRWWMTFDGVRLYMLNMMMAMWKWGRLRCSARNQTNLVLERSLTTLALSPSLHRQNRLSIFTPIHLWPPESTPKGLGLDRFGTLGGSESPFRQKCLNIN
jgi:hypothetical protein